MMKSTLRNLAVLLLLFITTASFAGSNPKFSIQKISKTAFVLNLNNEKETIVSIVLKDMSQYVLLEETLDLSKATHRQYNLKNLPSGEYTLIVDFGSVIKVQSLKMDFNELQFKKSDLTTFYKPVFNFDQDYLDVNMLCMDLKRVRFEFADEAGNVNYAKTVKVENTVGRRFDLSQLDPGKYKLSLAVNERGINRSFSKEITIEE